jgi:superfamily I DNA/RNA helicase
MPTESRVFGPPGTGKTTFLGRQVAKVRETVDEPQDIMVASFTKTAAAVIAERVQLPRECVGTLHSFAFRAIGRPEIAETKDEYIEDFNARYPHYRMTPPKPSMDEGEADVSFASENDRTFAEYQRQRALMLDKKFWPGEVVGFAEAWEAWKLDTDLADFTDLIDIALKAGSPPPNGATIGFFDETQDFTPLELALVRHWGSYMDHFILAGDDDQCHPAGTLIRTTRGDVPIEQLRGDELLHSYDRTGGAEIYRKGYKWSRSERQYLGRSCIFNVGHRILETTHDHRMMVRWRKSAVGAVAVYLQQRGENFRVGTTEVVRSQSGMFGPTQRARQEGADRVWVLDIFDDAFTARLNEEYISVKYGIPKAMFVAQSCDQTILDRHHDRFLNVAQIEPLLSDHGLCRNLPFWNSEEGQAGRGCKSWQIVRACNCFAHYMEMATDSGVSRKPEPVRISSIDREERDMIVYSLNVEPYHTYIAAGIITPNCIYGFKGATPEAFLDKSIPDTHKRILSQSYRVPRAVHRLASRIAGNLSSREPKDYAPRDADGYLARSTATFQYPLAVIDQIEEDIAEGKTVMVLAACAYMLQNMVAELRRKAIPFHNPYRRARGDWNPLSPRRGEGTASRLQAYLKPLPFIQGGRDMKWTGMDIQKWVPLVQSAGILKRGAKTRIANMMEEDQRRIQSKAYGLSDWFEPAALADPNFGSLRWLERNVLAAKEKSLDYPISIIHERGIDALMETPKVTIGTIHSVKGGEADRVYIFPDLSMAGMQEFLSVAAIRDRAIRQFYVAVTRAREGVIVCEPMGSAHFSLLTEGIDV